MAGDRIVYRGRPDGLLATSGQTDAAQIVPNPIYEGLVVDVIVDHDHLKYSHDGYNVGAIKVRILSINNTLDDKYLPWADPMESTIMELPLIGELVAIHKILGNFFYTRKVWVSRRIQENSMLNLNAALNNRKTNTAANSISGNKTVESNAHKFGEYFRPDSRVRQLKHFEGDTIIQGRMGNSIRFGSSRMDPSSPGMAPNIILRTGQGKNIETDYCTTNTVFGLTLEDVNRDASSIWMVADQVIPFEPITVKAGSFYRSISNPPQMFDGAQVLLNSDRIVVDAKKTHIMLFANEGIHLNSFMDSTIDTDNNIIFTANIDIWSKAGRNIDNIADEDHTIRAGKDVFSLSLEKTSMLAKKIYVGSVQDDKEPLVGGTSLSIFLARLILTIMGTPPSIPSQKAGTRPSMPQIASPGLATTMHVQTMVGPGILNPTIVKGLIKLYTELNTQNSGQRNKISFGGSPFNSRDNFMQIVNENPIPLMEKNKFDGGEQVKRENNKWELSASYYRVL